MKLQEKLSDATTSMRNLHIPEGIQDDIRDFIIQTANSHDN